MNILHISPHLGGGVGTVLLSFLEYAAEVSKDVHKIICLDDINHNALERLTNAGVFWKENLTRDHQEILFQISKADIVIVHWWNHPLLYEFLIKAFLPPCRLIIWAHISGSPPPNCFTNQIFCYPDKFVFTTPLSFYDPIYQALPKNIKRKVGVIWSTGGVERVMKYFNPKEKDNNLQVGYVGNLDFTKLHPSFVEICDSIDLENLTFVVIGPENKNLQALVEKSSKKKNYLLTGYISEKEKYQRLNEFTCFGYPLAKHHYATCDQTIQEAMALGVVPVVLSNAMESYMIENGVTGLIAHNVEQYKLYVREICTNHKLRFKISENARKFAINEYSISKLHDKWHRIFFETMGIVKTSKSWNIESCTNKNEGHNIFLESLGNYAGPFKDYISTKSFLEKDKIKSQIASLSAYPQWTSESKSTVRHYLKFFPNDQYLQEWSLLIAQAS